MTYCCETKLPHLFSCLSVGYSTEQLVLASLFNVLAIAKISLNLSILTLEAETRRCYYFITCLLGSLVGAFAD